MSADLGELAVLLRHVAERLEQVACDQAKNCRRDHLPIALPTQVDKRDFALACSAIVEENEMWTGLATELVPLLISRGIDIHVTTMGKLLRGSYEELAEFGVTLHRSHVRAGTRITLVRAGSDRAERPSVTRTARRISPGTSEG